MAASEAKAKAAKDRAKARRLADNFNLTIDMWECIYDFQGRKCAICKKPMNRPNVDHSHSDGLVRGILCASCNRALGRFRDSLELLRAAVEFLEHPPAVTALGKPIYGYAGRIGTKKQRKALKLKKSLDKLCPSVV